MCNHLTILGPYTVCVVQFGNLRLLMLFIYSYYSVVQKRYLVMYFFLSTGTQNVLAIPVPCKSKWSTWLLSSYQGTDG